MCLAVPSKVVLIDKEHFMAEVDVLGNTKKVGIVLIPDVCVGDWILVHAGQAISIVSDEEANESLAVWEEILRDYQA